MKKSTKFFAMLTVVTMAVTSILSGGVTAQKEVKAASTSYSYGYAYDCQRNPAFPKKGDNFSASSFANPFTESSGRGSITGDYTVTYLETYKDFLSDNSVDTDEKEGLKWTAMGIAGAYYGYENSDAGAASLPVYDVKDNGVHKVYIIPCAFLDGGNTLCAIGGRSDYGFVFSKSDLSGQVLNATIEEDVVGIVSAIEKGTFGEDTGNTDTGSTDTGSTDTGNAGTATTDTGNVGTATTDTGNAGTATTDTGNVGTATTDTGNAGTATTDTESNGTSTSADTTGTVNGRDGSVTIEKLKVDNNSTVVQSGSAAATTNKTVNEVIDILGASDTTAKKELIEAAVTAGNLKVKVNNTDSSKVSGTVNSVDLLISTLTGQEMVDGITGNDNIVLTLQIEEKDTSGMNTNLKSDVEKKATSTLGSGAKLYYVDVDLFLKKNAEAKQAITEFGDNSVEITLDIPKNIQKKNRTYQLIRTHLESSGKYSVTNLKDLDSEAYTYTIDTNKLCAMAFAYANVKAASATTTDDTTSTDTSSTTSTTATSTTTTTATAPKTGETNSLPLMVLVVAVMGLAVGVVRRKRA